MRAESLRMGVDKVQKVKVEVLNNMNQIEYEISRTRDNEKFYKHVDKLTESITDRKLLTAMERKAFRLVKKINHGETLELVENNIIILNVYGVDGLVYYRNDFGNWI